MIDAPERIWADWSPADEDTMPATIGCYTPKCRDVVRWKRVDYVRADLVEALPAVQPVTGAPVTLTYTNWRGETAQRTIIPQRVWFGSTDWHPEPQWLLTALDIEKGAERDFALKDFGSPAVQPDAARILDLLRAALGNGMTMQQLNEARALLKTPTEGQQ